MPAPQVTMPAGGAVPKWGHCHGGIRSGLPTSRSVLNPPLTQRVDNQRPPPPPSTSEGSPPQKVSKYVHPEVPPGNLPPPPPHLVALHPSPPCLTLPPDNPGDPAPGTLVLVGLCHRDVTCIDWHPCHPDLFVSGCADGGIGYWIVGYQDRSAPGHVAGVNKWTNKDKNHGKEVCGGSGLVCISFEIDRGLVTETVVLTGWRGPE